MSNHILGQWALAMTLNRDLPEQARDYIRRILHLQDPQNFPLGPQGLLDELFMAVTGRKAYGSALTFCDKCGYQAPGTTDTLGLKFAHLYSASYPLPG
jgi:hypothetical protein